MSDHDGFWLAASKEASKEDGEPNSRCTRSMDSKQFEFRVRAYPKMGFADLEGSYDYTLKIKRLTVLSK